MTDCKNDRPTLDCEIGEYVRAFSSSSNRVRWLIGSVLVTSLLIILGWRAAEGWQLSRVTLARIAYHCELWEGRDDLDKVAAECGYDAERVADAAEWAGVLRIRTKKRAARLLSAFEQVMLDTVATLRVPFLGYYFEINDLGIVGGVALSLLMVSLAIALCQQEENLFLSTWKIRMLAHHDHRHAKKGQLSPLERDERHDSSANVLYHALAIAQAFQNPPTLARFRYSPMQDVLHLGIFLAPLLAQWIVLDWSEANLKTAEMYSVELTTEGLLVQRLALLATAIAVGFCLLISVASQLRWRFTFFEINDHLRRRHLKKTPNWFVYLFRKPQPLASLESADMPDPNAAPPPAAPSP